MPSPTPGSVFSPPDRCRLARSGRSRQIAQAASENARARNFSSGFWRRRYPISDRACAAATESTSATPQLCEHLRMAKPKVQRTDRMPALVEALLGELGEDPDRQGLKGTPGRVSRALRELTDGYDVTAEDVIAGAIFDQDYDEMVLVKDIPFYSLCEHHLLPFFGTCHVGYLPKGKVVGLSKIPRLVEVFAHRLQLQE